MSNLMFNQLTEEQKEWFPIFVKLLLEKKPYLLTVDEIITKLNNGIINLTLRVHNGYVTDVISHETQRIVFKKHEEK